MRTPASTPRPTPRLLPPRSPHPLDRTGSHPEPPPDQWAAAPTLSAGWWRFVTSGLCSQSGSVGQCGDGLLQGALFGAAFFNPDKATSAGTAAAAFAVLLLPYSLVGPFAGVLLDRWSRQRTLLVSNALRGALVVLLAVSLERRGADRLAVDAACAADHQPQPVRAVRSVRVAAAGRRRPAPGDRQLLHHHPRHRRATAVGGIVSVQLRHVWGKDDTGAGPDRAGRRRCLRPDRPACRPRSPAADWVRNRRRRPSLCATR